MTNFWFLFILLQLDLAFLKNVEIIEDSPPKIVPINDSFVYINYENSVKIKNFSQINKLVLKDRLSGYSYGNSYATRSFIIARATRDRDKRYSSSQVYKD